MSNLPNPAHPPWCLRGPDCATSPGWHSSKLVIAAPLDDPVIEVGAGIWRLDEGPISATGLLLEFALGDDVERWPIDLAQSRALVPVLSVLLRRAETDNPRVA